ncbi:MFS transporter [Alkalicoccobacillus murimartini]|uniref:MFS family permease n=1 Tax=Alkalicoccobacillus murimartini TaxID=171685 RepID=A0ABT9YFM0_9BACI|nr:MFS transporter [Alkalicoccobacillus murimartini]MDQ0206647.1 MFS family permease [Alkalicoccobacillus murimartini]
MTQFASTWIQQIKKYNKNIRLFLFSSFLLNVGMGIFMVIYNYYIRELGYSDDVNGRVIAIQATATAIALLPVGLMSDRIGRKRLIVIGAVAVMFSLILRSVGVSEDLLISGAFMTGFFMAFIQVTSIPLLAENSKESERVHLFSLNAAFMMAANVIGNLLGGIVTDSLHVWFDFTMLESVRITLLIGVLIVCFGLMPLFKIKEERKIHEIKTRRLSGWKQLAEKKESLKLIGLFAIASILIGFGSGLVIPYLNLYFTDRFDISYSLVGIILALGQGMTAVAMLIGPSVVKRFGEVKAVVILQLGSLPFLLLSAYTEILWLAVIGFLFRQALMNAGNPIQSALMMRIVDPSMRGLANSIGQMVFQLGWAVMGPVSMGIVLLYGSYTGYAIVFSITAGLYLIGSIYFYFVFGRRVKHTPEALVMEKN